MKVLESVMRYLFVILFAASLLSSCNDRSSFKPISFDGSIAEVDTKKLINNQPVFYSVIIDDRRIDLFVVMVNGEVESYFNACLTCYPKKLGFSFKDGRVICRTCNESYPVDTLKDGIGNCYPIKLKGNMDNDRYIIKKEDLMAGSKYF